MLGSLGWQELLIVLVILALILGASRVADLGGALGKGIREFRREASSSEDKPDDKEKEETVVRSADDAPRSEAPRSNDS